MDILALLQCLQSAVPRTTLRQCSRIVAALLVMTGRVTMLGLSRWAGPGGSYRTVQRFFSQALPWAMRFWVFFRQPISRADEVYLLVGDEVVATKAGTSNSNFDFAKGSWLSIDTDFAKVEISRAPRRQR